MSKRWTVWFNLNNYLQVFPYGDKRNKNMSRQWTNMENNCENCENFK